MTIKAVALITGLVVALVPGAPLGAEGRTLARKHVQNGLLCYNCHQKEKPTDAAVPQESCMVCHGDYAAMAEYTRKLAVNPHDPPKKEGHPKPFLCTECHHQHKAPEVKCLECHTDFKLVAPA
jgi:hypothetical protein